MICNICSKQLLNDRENSKEPIQAKWKDEIISMHDHRNDAPRLIGSIIDLSSGCIRWRMVMTMVEALIY